jgi:hypothetical protein
LATILDGVAATGQLRGTPAKPSQVEKVIVAVHGIGDQPNYGTIQAVVNQFCRYVGQPSGIPLGNFYNDEPTFSIGEPHDVQLFRRFAFAEVYWASYPRTLAEEKHRLEETRAWAGTIVERLRLRYEVERKDVQRKSAALHISEIAVPQRPNFALLKQVMGEMVLTITVIDRICFLAEKAGIFSFRLKQLLDDYLGDVQVVAEFDAERRKILAAFRSTLDAIAVQYPNAQIYIVAHSEGTVVSFLGLLEGLSDANRPRWADDVAGFMTIGSPIDKHLILWPELFAKKSPSAKPKTRIQWRNYYDYGDPVGFELDGIRDWIGTNEWKDVFEFDECHDFGFARYPLPGKAHVDYWNDDDVFGHFLSTVVDSSCASNTGRPHTDPPQSKWWAPIASYAASYGAVFSLLAIAAFIMVKALMAALDPTDAIDESSASIAVRSAGLTALLFGITASCRVPRLTRKLMRRMGIFAITALCIALFAWSVKVTQPTLTGGRSANDYLTVGFAVAATILAAGLSLVRPNWGFKPLILITALATTIRIGMALYGSAGEVGPMWALVLATLAFLYLWWLGALVFDLVVVWQIYIRNFTIKEHMDRLTGRT